MTNLVRAANLRGYHELVKELGGDAADFLARYHIPVNILKDDQGFIPHRTLLMLIETTSRELGCENFGMRLSKWQGLDMLGPVAVIARNTNTLLNALESIAKYLYIHDPGLKLAIVDSGIENTYRFKFDIVDTNQIQLRQPYELSLANSAQIIRLLGGPDVKPQSICFMHKRLAPEDDYKATYGCPVRFEQEWNGFDLSETIAHRKIDSANADTLTFVTEFLESKFAPGTTTLSVRVSELVRKLLPTGQCNAITISEQLAMHPRTLQRRLAEESSRYDELLDNERRKLAKHYLSQSALPFSQITGLLGYAEQSAFNRSSKRWFGVTPKQFRRKHH